MSEKVTENQDVNSIESVTLPVKRVVGNTVEDNLTDNAYQNILPARYLRKNEEGEVVEDQSELFVRVAKNVALGDVPYMCDEEGVSIYMQPNDVKPKASHSRRQDLVHKYFGEDVSLDSDTELELTDENVKAFSYETVHPKLSDDMKASVAETKDEFASKMEDLSFMPNSPTLMNAGDELQQLSACFVDSPKDDINDIHDTAREAAKIFQSGGGNGYSFSDLRPYGDRVGSTGGIASGPISFMRTYDQMCETIAQGGKRRGAQMGILNVEHPDIIQFIHAKDKDVSLVYSLLLNDKDDFTHNSFGEALEEARDLVVENENGVKVVKDDHLRNAAEGHLSNFNISVGATSQFMDAVENDEYYTLYNPRTGEPYIANEHTKELYEWFDLADEVEVGEPLELPAREIWNRITRGAWDNGEPGVVYLDRINEKHSFDVEEYPEHKIKATNPCGEQPLEEYEACNLGHINLSTVVDSSTPDWRTWDKSENLEEDVQRFLDEAVDWHLLDERIISGTHFLENVVTMSEFPIDRIEEKVRQNRKIGLGIMGLAQMYVQMGIEYGTDEGNEVARQLMKYINHESKRVSRQMAEGYNGFAERGSFGNWHKSKYADPQAYPNWFESMTGEDPADWEDGFPIRNHNTTTIAPTGTTSMLGNTSGGCEPIYQVAYYKNVSGDVQGDEMLVEFDDYFLRTLEANDIDVEPIKKEAQRQMETNSFEGIRTLDSVPNEIGELFRTTNMLSAKEHASVQCALQKGVDSAISKTTNAPAEHQPEDAADTFMYVYKNGGKGVTYYRDGTRAKQVITTRKDNQDEVEDVDDAVEVVEDRINDGDLRISDLDIEQSEKLGEMPPEPRPSTLYGPTEEVKTGYGDLFVTINETEDGDEFEVFSAIGNSGGYTESWAEAVAKLISHNLRCGAKLEDIADHLEGIRSPKVAWDNGDQVYSVPDGISLAMKRHLETKESDGGHTTEKRDTGSTTTPSSRNLSDGEIPTCPECSSENLYYSEGCKTCEDCGWSEC